MFPNFDYRDYYQPTGVAPQVTPRVTPSGPSGANGFAARARRLAAQREASTSLRDRQRRNALARQAANQLARQRARKDAQREVERALMRGAPSTVTPNARASVTSLTDAQTLTAQSQGSAVPVTATLAQSGTVITRQNNEDVSVSRLLTELVSGEQTASPAPAGLKSVPSVVWIAAGFIAFTGLLLKVR